ncbi:MAG: PKD domain-containing protein, partial [Chitinivibrionales bacterium]|nr:PKD domain-containing protein [Chitinivibrionales bacterium]
YIVYLRVKDKSGVISQADSAIVHVMKSVPLVTIGRDTAIKAGVRMIFKPNITKSCGTIKRYEWKFNDDGKPDYVSDDNPNTSRVFFRPGKYHARFRVVDSNGNEAGAIQTISVVNEQPE